MESMGIEPLAHSPRTISGVSGWSGGGLLFPRAAKDLSIK
jgi:hypothetical protein